MTREENVEKDMVMLKIIQTAEGKRTNNKINDTKDENKLILIQKENK